MFELRWRDGDVFWRAGDRERQITSDQAVRLMALIWQQPNWRVEAVNVFHREGK